MVHVVVLGAGPSGMTLATELHGDADVTLVDPRDYFEVRYANLRVAVEPGFADRSLFPIKDVSKITKHIQAKATSIAATGNSVTLDNGSTLEFDYLAICTGSTHADAVAQARETSIVDARATKHVAYKSLQAAQDILVVGGGPVGIELAGEIATDMPDKKVTLVHAGEQLLVGRKPSVGNAARKKLERMNVKVLCGVKAAAQPDGSFKLGDGTVLRPDKVYQCVGAHPNTDFMKPNHAMLLDANGGILVNEHLQVKDHPNWFALGDANAVPETKLGYLAQQHGALAAKAIKALIASKGATASAVLPKWKLDGGSKLMVVTVGRNAGVGHMGNMSLPSFMVKKVKCKDLFVGKIRGELGIAN